MSDTVEPQGSIPARDEERDPRLDLLKATFADDEVADVELVQATVAEANAPQTNVAETTATKPALFDPFALPAPTAFAEIAALRAWVARLVTCWPVAEQVPACWERHVAIAAELAGAWATWRAVVSSRDPWEQLGWNERLLGVVERIESYDHAGCAARGVHGATEPPSWTPEDTSTSDNGEGETR